MSEELPSPGYWDVFPKSIRVSLNEAEQAIPLSIRGAVPAPVFESSNPDVVNVDENGVLIFGGAVGNAMVMVWDSLEKRSVRHVAVEVRSVAWFADHPDFQVRAMVQVQGRVIDALTTRGVRNATVLFRREMAGPAVGQAITDLAGNYQTNLREGTYYYEAVASNYIPASGQILVSPAGGSGVVIVLSPALVGQVARIVLQWGANPADLDSHLWGPLPNGTRYHVSFNNPHQINDADLDVDDTSSYGPETITILRFSPGPLRYYVHDYTNRNSSPSQALAQSGATVRLFLQSGQQYTFNVPNLPGTAWNVFEIDGATGAITLVNTMFYQSNPVLVGS